MQLLAARASPLRAAVYVSPRGWIVREAEQRFALQRAARRACPDRDPGRVVVRPGDRIGHPGRRVSGPTDPPSDEDRVLGRPRSEPARSSRSTSSVRSVTSPSRRRRRPRLAAGDPVASSRGRRTGPPCRLLRLRAPHSPALARAAPARDLRALEQQLVLRRSVALRNPHVDSMNAIQLEDLRRCRAGDEEVRLPQDASIAGIAAALRNTGEGGRVARCRQVQYPLSSMVGATIMFELEILLIVRPHAR